MIQAPQEAGAEMMGEGAPASATPMAEDQASTVELPLSAFPQAPAPGETISLKVVSVDQNSGVINATPISEEVEDTLEGANEGGSDSLAQEFNPTPA